MKHTVVISLVCVAVAEAVVLWLWEPRAQSMVTQANGLLVAPSPAESSKAAREIDRLKQENARLQARIEEIISASMKESHPRANESVEDVEKRLRAFQAAKKTAGSSVPLFKSSEGTLNPAFVDFYGLSAEEGGRLDAVLKEAQEAERRLDRAHTTVRTIDADTVEIKLAPYPKDGGVIYDRVEEAFRDVLGASRYESFLELSGNPVTGPFGNSGLMDATFVVKWDSQAKEYRVTEHSRVGAGRYSTEAAVKTIEKLDRFFPRLGPLLPDGMRAKAESDSL